jgi:hypothetical protein
MSKFELYGGVGIMGFISPMDTKDTYAVIDPMYGIDGFRNVESITDLNTIPLERRRSGMVVGVNGGEQYFKLRKISWVYNISDWVQIDLTKINYIDKEIPQGLINDNNKIFELSSEPILNSEHVYLNGLLQDNGDDYILIDNNLIFNESPMYNSKIRCSYRTL